RQLEEQRQAAQNQSNNEPTDAEAQNELGDKYYYAKNYEEAVKWYHKATEQGYAPAQFNLGFMYCAGYGARQDYQEALKWYRKAAEQGNADAQTNLGAMYEDGEGVKQDKAEAVKWYRKAAKQGDTIAQELLRQLGETW
ncbi:MAG: sel1 repeat family protein, partial [Synergistaceae bacterium]|nr:sel1 repeat family protein [Synergistaceae bacterium]